MTTKRTPAKIIPRAFPGISPGEVAELIANSQLRNYEPGTILCHENAFEDVFYLILDGDVDVSKAISKNETRLLKSLGPGDFFGEMALIHNAPRAATVRTRTPLIVLEINREAFERVLKHSSSVSLALVREISRRLRENDEMAIDDLRIRAHELAEAYQKLAEQDLARREFLTNIAHQLRTPLMTANGYLQLMNNGAIPVAGIPQVMETITRNVQQINNLVNDILFIQEMDLILEKFEPVDITKLILSITKKHSEITSSIPVKLVFEENLPPVAGDPRHLERALAALVDNAIKFSPNGEKVSVDVRREKNSIIIEVKDQGVGIEPNLIPRLFNRYYHLDKKDGQLFEGAGLGLAITNQVIKQHQGTLDVISSPGKGSTFIIGLNVWKDEDSSDEKIYSLY